MADKRGRSYRQSHSSNIDRASSWVSKWWGEDLTDLSIAELIIECPSPKQLRSYAEEASYIDAFRKKNESDLHKLLKYSAWLWLEQQEPLKDFEDERSAIEQLAYFPSQEAKSVNIIYPDGTPDDHKFDVTLPQLVPKGFKYAAFSYGHSITIDVFGKGRNIKVGQTQPMNLCYPFLYGMSDAAICIPFPDGIKPKTFSLTSHELRTIPAYEFRFIEG